jgi:hypothetical protein
VKGELMLTNHQDKAIKTEVTKKISGEVILAEPDANVETQATILAGVNTRRTLKWSSDSPVL